MYVNVLNLQRFNVVSIGYRCKERPFLGPGWFLGLVGRPGHSYLESPFGGTKWAKQKLISGDAERKVEREREMRWDWDIVEML